MPMARRKVRGRTSTLSISLTEELAGAISDRVQSGLYTSASELIREALRLLLKVEVLQRSRLEHRLPVAAIEGETGIAMRFATAIELFDLGASLREMRLLRGASDSSDEKLQSRQRLEEEESEAGPGLRVAPDRLAKLKVDE